MEQQVTARIHGNTLGYTSELMSFLHALERVYNYSAAFQKVLLEENPMQFGKIDKYQIQRLVPPNERLCLAKIQISSPGFWEAFGALNIFETLRKYIDDRARRKERQQLLPHEVREKELENRQKEQELFKQQAEFLKSIGYSDYEIRDIMRPQLTILGLLDKHIEAERVPRIEIVPAFA